MKGGYTKSKMLHACCFCFLAGVTAAEIFPVWSIGLMLLFLRGTARQIGVALCCGVFGYVLAGLALPTEVSEGVRSIQATIVREPDVRQEKVNYVIEEQGILYQLTYALYPRFSYGDRIHVDCRLRTPKPFDGFRYDRYLAVSGISSICIPEGHVRHLGYERLQLDALLQFKEWVAKRIQQLWPEPYAGFMAGLLYGYRGGLGSLNDAFAATGVTHIVAISGYNISVIVMIISRALQLVGVGRKKAFWVMLAAISLFVLFVGASPSVVRAGVFGTLMLLALHMGRASVALHLLLVTATIMVVMNPLILLWDVGFQLSFLATLGLLVIAPIVEQRMPISDVFGLRTSIAATVSATVATLPLIVYQFGRVSLVSLPTNVLILWSIPWIMLTGLIAVVFPLFETITVTISYLLMRYVIAIVQWFAGFSFAQREYYLPLWVVVTLYVVLYMSIKKLTHQAKKHLCPPHA